MKQIQHRCVTNASAHVQSLYSLKGSMSWPVSLARTVSRLAIYDSSVLWVAFRASMLLAVIDEYCGAYDLTRGETK